LSCEIEPAEVLTSSNGNGNQTDGTATKNFTESPRSKAMRMAKELGLSPAYIGHLRTCGRRDLIARLNWLKCQVED
jgi:hypothetical protein